jgi:hypothetical protein
MENMITWSYVYMRPLTLVPFLLLLLAGNSLAQDNKCTVKLADLPAAPELFGFHMGMATAQVEQRVPQVAFGPVNDFGLSQTSISPDFNPKIDKTSLRGVRTVSLDFLDGRLTSLWLGFDSSFKWQTVPDFVEGVSASFHLPNAWQTWKVRGQQLSCADFQMTVSIVSEGPSFRIVDVTAAKTIATRRAKLEAASEENDAGEPNEVFADRHAMVYYLPSCAPPVEIKEADKLRFKTRHEAEKAGYKPAKDCQ